MDQVLSPVLSDKTLAVFFSFGVSLKTWNDAGLIEREIAAYNRMAEIFRTIYFFTYGDQGDLQYQTMLAENLRIVPQPYRLPSMFYALAMPLTHRAILRRVDVLKTLQISGAWAALPAKYMYNKLLVVRCGYQYTLNLRRQMSTKRGRLRAVFFALYVAYTLLEWMAYRAADQIILTSKRDCDYVTMRYRIDPEKIKLLPNAIDVKLFRPMSIITRDRRKLCFVGRLSTEKNLYNLFDAVDGLGVQLVIFGDGPLRDPLQQYAMRKGIYNVVFRGTIPNSSLPVELNSSAIFLLVSQYEGNPKALLEAMACGLPVIGSDVEGIRQVITHGENGYLCPPTALGIRDAIQTVLNDPALMARIGQKARQTVLERYSLDKLLAKEIELLRELMQ